MEQGKNTIVLLAILAASVLAASPASAQSSWWAKNATPTPTTPAGAALSETMLTSTQEMTLTMATPMQRRTEWPTQAGLPLLFGAVHLIGPHGHRVPANIIRRFNGGEVYLVQTRKGTQIVSLDDILDPLVSHYPENDQRAIESNPFLIDKRLY